MVTGNEDHKQRVNLSSFARSVIEFDMSLFDPEGSVSGFLNRIITAFWESAEASVDLATEERRQQLTSGGFEPEIVSRLVEEHRTLLIRKLQEYPSGDSLSFRLNNRNHKLLYEDRAESTAYSAPSKYLKALFEEYARLSPSKRERIYYDSIIKQQLEPAMAGGNLLEVQLGSKAFFVKPYGIMSDPFNSHLYLVGLSYSTGEALEKETIASFRISRIKQVKQKKQRGKLSAEERRTVEKHLRQVGVQYLLGSSGQIKVRLSPAGRQAFLQRSYMRPVPEQVQDDIYTFNCTQMQIQNYFISFGKDAEVLEPLSLRERFAVVYREAAAVYEETPADCRGSN